MKYFPLLKARHCLAFAVVYFIFASHAVASNPSKVEWRPVTPGELTLSKPKVEPGADAEAIFWETRLDDKNSSRLSIEHYVRVKIFTERGREQFSKMDIPFTKGKRIADVAARVIKPDGSIVELQSGDIFEREVARRGKSRYMAKSFAIPGIEIGAIVEYQYTEHIRDDSLTGERLIFQRDIPLQKVSYYVRPYGRSTVKFNWYNLPEGRFADDKKGFQVATLYNVPAYKEEPYMPPDDEVRQWAYITYNTWGNLLVWPFVSGTWGTVFKDMVKPNKEIREKAEQLIAGAASDDEKLRRLYDYTQKQIRNITFDSSMTDDERDKVKAKSASEVMKRGMGNAVMVEMLFASLAKAAGYEVNFVMSADRRENFFSPDKYPFRSFIEPTCVAVKVRNDWRFFNPGIPYLGFEQMAWYKEGVNSMMIGENGSYIWKTTGKAGYSASAANRTARLRLSEDGTLSGKVTIAYTGHQATGRRREEFRDSQVKREENFKEEFKSRVSTAEITQLSITNFDDPMKPLTYTFDVRIPGYAQRAGSRLILQPGFFEYGSTPVFSSATRTYSVHFPYPWAEKDDVEIQLPKGFELDNADAPADLTDPQNIGSLKINMGVDREANTLSFSRTFHFGGGGATLFPVQSYPAVKMLFDGFHKADTHALALRAPR
ncbi:MAG: DUF3857 and transglutaminase domain-containing protein [Blastocatellia bacterium]|nr:DUF3857 and transglutaminase domain-containing protein [Blastocatellia bacterium]